MKPRRAFVLPLLASLFCGADAQAQPAPRDLSNPLWSTPLGELSATRERPLFSPNRRPAAAPAAPFVGASGGAVPMQVAAPPQLQLLGTAIGDGEEVAVFVDQASGKAVRLRVGETISGWSLKSVSGRAAELARDGAATTIEMQTARGGGTVAAPIAPMAPAAPAAPGLPPGMSIPGMTGN